MKKWQERMAAGAIATSSLLGSGCDDKPDAAEKAKIEAEASARDAARKKQSEEWEKRRVEQDIAEAGSRENYFASRATQEFYSSARSSYEISRLAELIESLANESKEVISTVRKTLESHKATVSDPQAGPKLLANIVHDCDTDAVKQAFIEDEKKVSAVRDNAILLLDTGISRIDAMGQKKAEAEEPKAQRGR